MGCQHGANLAKHYRVRPFDLLRLWHRKAWILELAGIEFTPDKARLRVVSGETGRQTKRCCNVKSTGMHDIQDYVTAEG